MSGEIQKQFVFTSKIGSGNFSTVFLAKNIQTQQIVAIKTMKNHISIAVKQAQILKRLNHPNIIKLFKFEKPQNKEEALMVLEYIPQNILQLYEAQEYGLKEEQVKCILFQTCLGLYHIHQKGIIHRDLKPQNIMINRNKAEVKLIDFGLAIQQAHCVTDYVATRWYRAPENLLGTKQYTVAIDIFSLGCVIVELYMGSPLFPGSNNVDQISKILSILGEPTFHSWRKGYEMFLKLGLDFQLRTDKKKKNLKNLMTSCSQGLLKLIQRMLILNPSKRITAEQVLKDPYFNDIEKIIPPHVYEQYLFDIKQKRTSFARQIPEKNRKSITKQRIRFLSEEKGFGAFLSFNSALPTTNLKNNSIANASKSKDKQVDKDAKYHPSREFKSKEKYLYHTNQPKNHAYMPTKDKYQKPQQKVTFLQTSSQQKLSLTPNKGEQNLSTTHKKTISFTGDISSKIKNSIHDYQKNLLKVNASLENIKILNRQNHFQEKQNIADKYISKENCRSQQMLSFRGFNHPKQRFQPIKQTNSVKKIQTTNKFPIKSKKVMEYLQKFQNTQNKKQEQVCQHKQSEIFIHDSSNGYPSIPKKSSFFNFDSHNRPFCSKQSIQIKSKEGVHFPETSLNQQQKKYEPFHSRTTSLTFDALHSYHGEFRSIKRNDKSNQKDSKSIQNRHDINSPSLQKSNHTQLIKGFESPIKKINQISKVKFNQANSQTYLLQNIKQKSQAITHLDKPSHFPFQKRFSNYQNQKTEKNDKELSRDPTPFQRNLQIPTNFSNANSMNVSSSRPIENKIRMIAVRQSIMNQHPVKQSLMNQNSSVQNPSPFKNVSMHIKKQPPFHNELNFIRKDPIQINNPSLAYSPRKETQSFQSPSKFSQHYLQFPHANNFQSNSQSKYFKSMDNSQLPVKESGERFSAIFQVPEYNKEKNNHSYLTKQQHTPLIESNYYSSASKKTYFPSNQQNPCHFQKQQRPIQKFSHIGLGQIRQSITGFSKSGNQGNLLSERSQRSNNKHININLNLNIFQQKSNRKK